MSSSPRGLCLPEPRLWVGLEVPVATDSALDGVAASLVVSLLQDEDEPHPDSQLLSLELTNSLLTRDGLPLLQPLPLLLPLAASSLSAPCSSGGGGRRLASLGSNLQLNTPRKLACSRQRRARVSANSALVNNVHTCSYLADLEHSERLDRSLLGDAGSVDAVLARRDSVNQC